MPTVYWRHWLRFGGSTTQDHLAIPTIHWQLHLCLISGNIKTPFPLKHRLLSNNIEWSGSWRLHYLACGMVSNASVIIIFLNLGGQSLPGNFISFLPKGHQEFLKGHIKCPQSQNTTHTPPTMLDVACHVIWLFCTSLAKNTQATKSLTEPFPAKYKTFAHRDLTCCNAWTDQSTDVCWW